MSTGMAAPNGDGRGQTPVRWLPGIDAQTFGVACPHLGLAGDASSHCTFVTGGHRCFQTPRPRTIPANVQSTLCLSTRFERCPIFQGAVSDVRDSRRLIVPLLSLAVVALLLVVALAVILSLRLRTGSGGSLRPELAAATATDADLPLVQAAPASPVVVQPLTSVTIAASPAAAPSPVVTPAPSAAPPPPSPTPAPTPSATPVPVPTPAPATHLVRAGESIWSIAARYGIDPAALSQLNRIPWNDTIYPGEVLRLR